jgi:hypothetical protein
LRVHAGRLKSAQDYTSSCPSCFPDLPRDCGRVEEELLKCFPRPAAIRRWAQGPEIVFQITISTLTFAESSFPNDRNVATV